MINHFYFPRVILVVFLCYSSLVHSQTVPLNQENLVRHLDQELSGEIAKRNLEFISRLHRMRGSDDYNKAINFISEKLAEYNLSNVEIIDIPTDGVTMYGTQKGRKAWNAQFAQLWEMKKVDGTWIKDEKVADWESIPLVLAQDSESGEAQAELVDIGKGTTDADYMGKDISGKLVLTSSQPGAVAELAVKKYGAIGILSYAQNQVTAWYKENDNLIRWGHLETFSEVKTFGFMLSLKQARAFQQRLSSGETIMLNAKVVAGQTNANYKILTAAIEGSDSELKNQEIVFSCHLDHPRPGANDNASGSVAILEIARALQSLIDKNQLERPRRTIRFIWSPEIEGTTALLNFKPELTKRMIANIHLDMVGGGPETKAIFHVSRTPASLPSFINYVGEAFGEFVNKSSDAYASGKNVRFPIVSEEGGKEALNAVLGEFSMGSDFEVYNEGSFRIPSIYLHDWPDRYIHTNYDVPANIDPTKLKRSSFIGAASAYYLANLDGDNAGQLISLVESSILSKLSDITALNFNLDKPLVENALYQFWKQQNQLFGSIEKYITLPKDAIDKHKLFIKNLKSAVGSGQPIKSDNKSASTVYVRNKEIKGPMSVFGYSYFSDHYSKEKPSPKLLGFSSATASGGEYTYETLNLVNGTNSVLDITNILSAEFGAVPIEIVSEYLEALESIEVINKM